MAADDRLPYRVVDLVISDETRLEAFSLVVHKLRERIDKLVDERDRARAARDRYRDRCRDLEKRAELAKIRAQSKKR